MDFQGVGSLIKNKKELEGRSGIDDHQEAYRAMLTSPQRSTDSPKNFNLPIYQKKNQKRDSLNGTYCQLDIQVKDLCYKVFRINNLNEAIKTFFAQNHSKPGDCLNSNTSKTNSQSISYHKNRHTLMSQIQMSFRDFLNQQFDQLYNWSNIQKCIMSADSLLSPAQPPIFQNLATIENKSNT
jgi:hypothetical protein